MRSEPARPRATEDAMRLEITGLSVRFQTSRTANPALNEVSLAVRAGEFVAVVGESGSGKSTLCKSVMGLLPPGTKRVGSIRLAGAELAPNDERAFARVRGREVALIPQDPGRSLDPVMSIGRQLTEVIRLDGGISRTDAKARAIELLDMVRIDRAEQRLKQYPHELSGGMKQRVLIAMAIARGPDVLIADEPTSALDVTVQREILKLIVDLSQRLHTSVLFVTHDLGLATDHADRIVVMKDGCIVEDATSDQLMSSPASAYASKLLEFARPTSGWVVYEDEPEEAGESVPAVSVREVSKDFGGFLAVDNVSFEVPHGSSFALVGESGSGKTTTARIVLSLTNPTSGEVMIDGENTSKYQGTARKHLWQHAQLVYQNPDSALDPRWTIERTIGEPLRCYGLGDTKQRAKRIRELVDRVSLPSSVLKRRPRELSGGQLQRVAIARALAPNARTIVLDEALSALDVLTQAQVLDLLGDLREQLGLTYIFISHDMNMVARICERVAVMNKGKVVEAGLTRDVFANPQSEYTQALLAAKPGRRLAAREARPDGVGSSSD